MTEYHENLWIKRRETFSEETCQFMLADKREWMKWLEEHYGEILKQTEKHVKDKLEKERLELEDFENFMKSKNYSLSENQVQVLSKAEKLVQSVTNTVKNSVYSQLNGLDFTQKRLSNTFDLP